MTNLDLDHLHVALQQILDIQDLISADSMGSQMACNFLLSGLHYFMQQFSSANEPLHARRSPSAHSIQHHHGLLNHSVASLVVPSILRGGL